MNFTPLNEAFQYNNPLILNKPSFSLHCIYCQSTQTSGLIQDGSFRQCLNLSCRKQFQAKINPPATQVPFTTVKQRHPNEYIMFNQEHLKQQANQDQNPTQNPNHHIPNTIQQTQYTSFSHPNYDHQISKK